MHLVMDGKAVECRADEPVLTSLVRANEHPTSGGCLCFGGDCSHCVATVNGVSYVRTCQVKAKPGMRIERHPASGEPPLPTDHTRRADTPIRFLFCDVAVVMYGPDPAGLAAYQESLSGGKETLLFNSDLGQEAVAIYSGPLLVVRTDEEMLHVQVREKLIVATGAAEIQPVVPGSHLKGLYTPHAVVSLLRSGVDLGVVAAYGDPPQELKCLRTEGELVRFEGADGRVSQLVTKLDSGEEMKYSCESVVVNLGKHPRDQLALMASDLPLEVELVGEATCQSKVPKCPKEGIICACSGVSMADLEYTWDSGFQEMELIKRSTLAGTGTCQGMGCIPYLRSFIQQKGGELQPRFTARPMVRQLTLGEVAAGAQDPPDLRTALHQEHIRMGAWMERSGPWWRPWNYGDPQEEYWAVREGVSIMDVSTLGKMIVTGPDVLELLEWIYPTKVATIKTGRTRYALCFDERGYVFDDGLIAKVSDTRYDLTFTSSGASHAEMWLRDWAHGYKLDVRILNHTYSTGAINVTGPQSGELLKRMGLEQDLRFMGFVDHELKGIPCRIYRLSFTGELSFELHHPTEHSVDLWRALLREGKDLGIKPHGLEVLELLRLEKGHIIVHKDTDFDSTPRRIQHEWAVKMEKDSFVGRGALSRTSSTELNQKLVGLEMDGPAPIEGASLWWKDEYAGFVTSSGFSHCLSKTVLMAHLYIFDGLLPEEVVVDGRPARRVELPFYDKEGKRARS